MNLNVAIGSGAFTYEDITDVVEAIVYTEGRRCPIPGMEFEDTAQEIRAECIRVLQFYDPSRIGPSPYKFLQTCIRNFLYNQRRGVWVPNNPPCVRCPLWDKVKKTCVIDEVGCDKIVQYRQNMAIKAAIRQPVSLAFEIIDNYQEENLNASTLDDNIREAMPDNLLNYYEKMLSGEKVPVSIRQQIREIVVLVINNA